MLEVRADFVHPYDRSCGWFVDESDFPGPRTMSAAAAWIDDHSRHHDRFFLFVDEFDPHEPFDTPEPWASRYDDEWDVAKDGPRLVWPPYATDVVANGYLSEREAAQTRANYGSKLSMIDHWFGKVLDAIDRQSCGTTRRSSCAPITACSSVSRDIWGKPSLPFFEPFGHTPLLVSWPGVQPGSCGALTTNVDIHATVRDIFDAPSHAYRLHGRSLAPIARRIVDRDPGVRADGIWGCEVQITDGRYKYVRSAAGEPTAVDVVEPLVLHHPLQLGGGAATQPRPTRVPRLHARNRLSRHPPALRRE